MWIIPGSHRGLQPEHKVLETGSISILGCMVWRHALSWVRETQLYAAILSLGLRIITAAVSSPFYPRIDRNPVSQTSFIFLNPV